ncbi:hypothetical protein [Dawidia soli]|uniref:Uncharacterized protein n=1 Tax=Dawidia soli TaxID=2782352 RepID=A0AAP2DFR7_9BACT|nr:hypothetical protein [Dawidia soli]MBT1689875.1 hypothetical protein [Dawidia soli]
MKKNMYYRFAYRRSLVINSFLSNSFVSACSWPRLLLEVFLRRDMGERYFSLASAITIATLLAVGPVADSLFSFLFMKRHVFIWPSLNWDMISWYAFIAAFISFSLKRNREIKRDANTFDFSRFSLSSGEIDPWFSEVKLFGRVATPRSIETLYEPGMCFLAGVGLVLLWQPVGYLIIVCSILYSLSYVAAYRIGDNFVLDKADEIIAGKNQFRAFVDDTGIDGFRFRSRKPESRADRERFIHSFSALDEDPFNVL